MQDAVATLEAAAETADPAEVFAVTQRAIASALKVILRADDSSGIIGDACRGLLDLHPKLAAQANPPVAKLVDWMIAFQFDNEANFFQLDPVAYAPALAETGMAAYRRRLAELEARLGPRPAEGQRWSRSHSHEWFTLEWNAQRLAVLDRDVETIIRTHARDESVPAWLQDTAEALAEIGELDLAIDWAKKAVDMGDSFQSLAAAGYWCELLSKHRPHELAAARLDVFRRWPTSHTAAALHDDAGTAWVHYRDEVMARLASSPRDAVRFALDSLKNPEYAWKLAHSLDLADDRVWSDLAKAYERVDKFAVLPVLNRLVLGELVEADARHYRIAARRLKRMRKIAAGSEHAAEVDWLIAELRESNRRRPRLQEEFNRAGLP